MSDRLNGPLNVAFATKSPHPESETRIAAGASTSGCQSLIMGRYVNSSPCFSPALQALPGPQRAASPRPDRSAVGARTARNTRPDHSATAAQIDRNTTPGRLPRRRATMSSEDQVLGKQARARRHDGQDEIEQEADYEHGTAYHGAAVRGAGNGGRSVRPDLRRAGRHFPRRNRFRRASCTKLPAPQ